MSRIEREACQQFYDEDPLFAKIRAHVCHQDEKADWDDLNKRYNDLMSQVECGQELSMPAHVYV